MASSSYAAVSDLTGTGGYLRDVNATANNAILTTLLAVSSRFIDQMTGQVFYDDGFYLQPLDAQGISHIDTLLPFFFSSGTIASAAKGATSLAYTTSTLAPNIPQVNDSITLDTASLRETLVISAVSGSANPYTLTVPATGFAHVSGIMATTLQVELAYFENQPLAQRIVTLDGDAVNPPSNMLAWPRTRPRIGAANQSTADNTSRWPWYGVDISHIPISNTTFLPSSIPGYQTVRIGAHWGWPVVPDLVKDLTCKYAARLWRMRQAGESDQGGTGEIGTASTHLHFDPSDEATLLSSRLKRMYV